MGDSEAGRRRRGRGQPAGTRDPKPLLGFGWAGWVLLAPLAVLIWVAVSGFDLRYEIQSAVNERFGWDGLVFVTLNVVYAHAWASWFWPPLPHFGLVGMCIVLLGLQVHPCRVGFWRTGLVVALGVLMPVALFCMYQRNPLFNAGNEHAQFAISRLVAGTLVAVAIWLATRSGRVGVGVGLVFLVAPALDWAALMCELGELPASLAPHIQEGQWWVGLWVNAGLAAILWPWAVRARMAVRPEHACSACGYDLRSLGGPVCPECGLAIEGTGASTGAAGAA